MNQICENCGRLVVPADPADHGQNFQCIGHLSNPQSCPGTSRSKPVSKPIAWIKPASAKVEVTPPVDEVALPAPETAEEPSTTTQAYVSKKSKGVAKK